MLAYSLKFVGGDGDVLYELDSFFLYYLTSTDTTPCPDGNIRLSGMRRR